MATHDIIAILDGVVVAVVQKPSTKGYEPGDFPGIELDTITTVPPGTFAVGEAYDQEKLLTDEDRRRSAIGQAAMELEQAAKAFTVNVPESEVASWARQEREARSWIADPATPTPLIDTLLLGRQQADETKADLVNKIIAKADQFATAYGSILGQYHRTLKSIEATYSPTTP